MKLRHRETREICSSSVFNLHSLNEIIVGFESGDMTSDFIREYDVFLEKRQQWKSLVQAFKDHDVINDNLNTRFFEPQTLEDKERGYTL